MITRYGSNHIKHNPGVWRGGAHKTHAFPREDGMNFLFSGEGAAHRAAFEALNRSQAVI
jgi:hypothetical protein